MLGLIKYFNYRVTNDFFYKFKAKSKSCQVNFLLVLNT